MAVIIGLDARSIYAKSRRGTGKNLLDAYRMMARLRPEWRFVLYHRGAVQDDPLADLPNVSSRVIEMPGDQWDLWEHLRLPAAARGDGVDVLHCPANSCPKFRWTRMVSTIHDLIPLKISDPGANGFAGRILVPQLPGLARRTRARSRRRETWSYSPRAHPERKHRGAEPRSHRDGLRYASCISSKP